MSGTRLNNIEKRLKYVAQQGVPAFDESKRVISTLLPRTLRSARRALPCFVAVWSMGELPIELILAQSPTERLASAAGRLIWVVLAIAAMRGSRFASTIFLFLCAVSSLVVAQGLPIAYHSSALVFSVLLVDFALKLSLLLASLLLSLMAAKSG
ncbi:hypothetical protein SB861_36415 [Paraburkholderia sp. SIMBA_049]